MKANDKIHVAEYLNDLNESAKHACIYHNLDKGTIKPLTCKELAEKCEVTPATITNLTTSSKFCLLFRVAEEILDAYYGYFMYDERKAREENPDELIYPRDKNYVLMYLTSYYTDEFMNNQNTGENAGATNGCAPAHVNLHALVSAIVSAGQAHYTI